MTPVTSIIVPLYQGEKVIVKMFRGYLETLGV